jgi:hypothetical protein
MSIGGRFGELRDMSRNNLTLGVTIIHQYYPGFIDLPPKSDTFKGNWKLKPTPAEVAREI